MHFRVLLLIALLLIAGILFGVLRRDHERPYPIHNLLLISIDTCRPDYLSCYGNPDRTTPNIDALAAEGILYQNAISPIPITLPAHSSMLTGTNPPHHGVHDNLDYYLTQDHVTLAELLRDHGLTTGAFISAFVLDSQFGLDQGFQTYDDQFVEARVAVNIRERKGQEASQVALKWLNSHQSEPFFLFLHYYDPHFEYDPPAPFAAQFTDPYAGEIAYVDACLGQVIERLKQLQLYDSTLIIVTSDHGEMLGEHGEGEHSFFIYQSAIRVPLIIKLPGSSQAQTIESLAGLIDIVPTVCGLFGIQPPPEAHGRDLSASLGKSERYYYCESFTPTKYNASPLLSVVTKDWTFIHSTRPELYHLAEDPKETKNAVDVYPDRARVLQHRLKEMVEEYHRDDTDAHRPVDDNTQQQIESLGYTGGALIVDYRFGQGNDDAKDLIGFHQDNTRINNLLSQKKLAEAQLLCEEMLHQRPNFVDGHLQLAKILKSKGDFNAAVQHLQEALKLNPEHVKARNSLGIALAEQGKHSEAIAQFEKALELQPQYAEAHYNMAVVLSSQSRLDDAIHHYRQASKLKPGYTKAHVNLAVVLQGLGRFEEAIRYYQKALKSKPNALFIREKLATQLLLIGNLDGALTQYRESLRLDPNTPSFLNGAAWILATHPDATVRKPQEAINLAERAADLTNHEDAAILDTLAAAFAADSQFGRAAATAQQALTLASPKDHALAEQIREHLTLYQQQIPYRETNLPPPEVSDPPIGEGC